MPLQLNYTEPRTGVPHPSSYWAIEEAIIRPVANHTLFIIGGWHDVSQYNAGGQPFKRLAYSFNQVPTGNQTFAQVVASLYTYVQNNANPETNTLFFAGATVVP